jgi:hypothetical protein
MGKVVWLAAVFSTPSEGAQIIGIFGTKAKAVQAMDEHFVFMEKHTMKKEDLLGITVYRFCGLTVASVAPYEINRITTGQNL